MAALPAMETHREIPALVIPAKAGIQLSVELYTVDICLVESWIPAFAGMTG
jgi:hypothetical protein